MDGRYGDDIFTQVMVVVDEHDARLDLDAARALIDGAFAALPWELQDDYRDIQELHRSGQYEEASRAWNAWMAKARDMGLI